MSKKLFITCLASLVFSGCANMPDLKLTYYPPKVDVRMTVTQTVLCADTSNPIVKTNVKFTSEYSANYNIQPAKIDFYTLDTWYSSGSGTVTLTKDGRLSSFNSTATGAGKDVVDTLIEISDLTQITKGVDLVDVKPSDIQKACKIINKLAGQTKGEQNPLSIQLTSNVVIKGDVDEHAISNTAFKLSGYPETIYKSIMSATGVLEFDSVLENNLSAPVEPPDPKIPGLALVEPGIVKITVTVKDYVYNDEKKHTAYVPVPQLGQPYFLPIPKPPFFGSNELELKLYESGRIEKIKFGKTNGIADARTSLANVAKQFKDQTDAEKAAELKAQADVMAQQQRIVVCEADPVKCK